ncbi:MAG: IclR family transcriptional regulator [Trichlorobacter sp.]|nr:IclR family transcriptional regulator [Trichlorobacter sp.]
MRAIREDHIASIENALLLFELIAKSDEPLTPATLAQDTGLSVSKVNNFLELLADRGFIEKDKGLGFCLVGIKGIQLSQAIISNMNVLKYAKPVMQVLEKEHDEAIYLAMLNKTNVVFLDMVDTEQPVKAVSFIGHSFPFFTNAAGKVIMAFEPRDYLQQHLNRILRKRSDVNITHFMEELDEIRSKGAAVDVGGLGENILSVAVAVKDYAGKVLGAITLIAPAFRVLGERLETEIIPSMIESAGVLSARFGYVIA